MKIIKVESGKYSGAQPESKKCIMMQFFKNIVVFRFRPKGNVILNVRKPLFPMLFLCFKGSMPLGAQGKGKGERLKRKGWKANAKGKMEGKGNRERQRQREKARVKGERGKDSRLTEDPCFPCV